MRFATGLIVSALVSLALMAGAVFFLGQVCGPAGVQETRSPLPVSFEDRATRALPSLDTRDLLVRVQLSEPSKPPMPFAMTGWLRTFLCMVKATDVAIAGFGLFLALALAFNGLMQGAGMGRALAASERSTKVVSKVVDEALVSAQRPYVFLREFRVNLIRNPLNEEIQVCTIQPIWENTGSTPTRNGRGHVNWKFFERSIPAEFDFPDFDEVGNRVLAYDAYKPLIVGPRATALSPLIDIEPSVLRQVRDLQGKVLIWGWAEYDEIFRDAKRHRCEFCYQLVVTGSPMTWVGFTQYRTFNGADEDCTKAATALVRTA